MGAGQYQEYADAIFCAAADALLAPPMQAPQVLSPWLSPVESTVLVDGLPMWQGALRLAPQTSATDVALAAVSNAEIPSAPTLKVALAATLAFENAHSETGQTACVEPVTAEAAGKALSAEVDQALDALGLARGAQVAPVRGVRGGVADRWFRGRWFRNASRHRRRYADEMAYMRGLRGAARPPPSPPDESRALSPSC